MIIHHEQSSSYGTDPVAGAVRAALRPATFRAARRADDAQASLGRAATFDVDALYPNLSHAPGRSSFAAAARYRLAAALAGVRHAIASL